jgi:hypothetical protein
MERLDNLQVYRRLMSLCDELSADADRCWSPLGRAALVAVATSARLLAHGLRQTGLNDDDLRVMTPPRLPRRFRVRR